jgi:hypothetical protein
MEEGFVMHLKYTLPVVTNVLLASCLICNVYASASSSVSNDLPHGDFSKRIVNEGQQSVTNIRGQLVRRKIQSNLREEQNQVLLNNLHRAIGFAPLFIITIIGLISYFTHRRYEQDKMLLMCIIKSEIAKVRAEFESRYSDFEKTAANDLLDKTKYLEQSLRSIAEEMSTDAVRPIDDRTKLLMENMTILKMEFSALEAEHLVNKGQLSSAVRCWLDVAQKAWAINWKWRVAYAIDNINHLLDKGAKITLKSSKAELSGFLQSLPPQFEPLVKAIQSKISL